MSKPRLFHTTHDGLVATNPVTMDLLVDPDAVYHPRGKAFSVAGEWPDTGMYFTYLRHQQRALFVRGSWQTPILLSK